MYFVDSAKITVRAGRGGNGCNSFYKDKLSRYRRADGGDGGRGADIIIRADKNLLTLYDFKFRQHFYAASGGHGSSNKKKGKDAPPTLIRVPLGTTLIDCRSNSRLRDLLEDGQELIAAKGGAGGKSNIHSEDGNFSGQPGEEKELLLDLKLIADVGLVGFPNSGKSTLISKISGAHPKVAAYPFTTKAPVLGIVEFDDRYFSIADIPGLIMGSSQGKGLGVRFLRHIERTRILIHIIDISAFEGRDPIEDYKNINKELEGYSKELLKKPQIIAANKMDLEGSKANLLRFKKAIKKEVYPISALNKDGLEELIEAVGKKL